MEINKLEEVLEGADIRRQQYAAIRDGESPHDVVDELYQCKEGEAELIAESYLVAIKYVREHYVSDAQALWGMMLWEHACEDRGVMDWLVQPEGAYQGRDNALLIGTKMSEASDWAYANGFDQGEDWEFVPRIMPVIMRLAPTPTDVTETICMDAAKIVVVKYLEERP